MCGEGRFSLGSGHIWTFWKFPLQKRKKIIHLEILIETSVQSITVIDGQTEAALTLTWSNHDSK